MAAEDITGLKLEFPWQQTVYLRSEECSFILYLACKISTQFFAETRNLLKSERFNVKFINMNVLRNSVLVHTGGDFEIPTRKKKKNLFDTMQASPIKLLAASF